MERFVLNSKYKLLKIIGEGGFGKVWLAKDNNEGFFAVKEVFNISENSHEYKGVMAYKQISDDIKSKNLISILDISVENGTLYYAMPLCDGIDLNSASSNNSFAEYEEFETEKISPLDDNWVPHTLLLDVELQRKKQEWYDRHEIEKIITPIILSVNELSDRGFLHRDIKPANIMFFNGEPCLGDIGLLTADTQSASYAGTPNFIAPDWFVNSHGNPDIWGLAMTLFVLLSGESADLYGRQAYRYPPQGKDKMTTKNIIAWDNFYQIILNATSKQPRNRYARVSDFAVDINLIASDNFNKPLPDINAQKFDSTLRKQRLLKNVFVVIGILSVCMLFFFLGNYFYPKKIVVEKVVQQKSAYEKNEDFILNTIKYCKTWQTNKNLIKDFEKLIDDGIHIRTDKLSDEYSVIKRIINFIGESSYHRKSFLVVPLLVDYYSKIGNTKRVEYILKSFEERSYIDFKENEIDDAFVLYDCIAKHKNKKIIKNIEYAIFSLCSISIHSNQKFVKDVYLKFRKYKAKEIMSSIASIFSDFYYDDLAQMMDCFEFMYENKEIEAVKKLEENLCIRMKSSGSLDECIKIYKFLYKYNLKDSIKRGKEHLTFLCKNKYGDAYSDEKLEALIKDIVKDAKQIN